VYGERHAKVPYLSQRDEVSLFQKLIERTEDYRSSNRAYCTFISLFGRSEYWLNQSSALQPLIKDILLMHRKLRYAPVMIYFFTSSGFKTQELLTNPDVGNLMIKIRIRTDPILL